MDLRAKHGLTGRGKAPEFMVLARAAETTRRLSALTEARPEHGEDVFERLEAKHRQLNGIIRDLVRARRLLDLGEHSKAFRCLDRGLSRLILKANPGFGAPDSLGLTRDSWRSMVCEVLGELPRLNAEDVVPWTDSIRAEVQSAIVKAGGRKSGQKLVLLGKLKDYLEKKAKYRTEDALRSVDVSEDVASAVRTIHRAKGLEAEAVLLVAERGHLTRWMNAFGSGKPRTEEARIGYVGLSRATKLLCIATDSIIPETQKVLEAAGVVLAELKADGRRVE